MRMTEPRRAVLAEAHSRWQATAEEIGQHFVRAGRWGDPASSRIHLRAAHDAGLLKRAGRNGNAYIYRMTGAGRAALEAEDAAR